jgi:uncharacterized membrane protein
MKVLGRMFILGIITAADVTTCDPLSCTLGTDKRQTTERTSQSMGKNRMETFFDGVVAIIITIMVLEMKVPHGESIETLSPLIPVLLSYVLSFVYLGIYWNNHHHMMHVTHRVTGSILWANLHLLFWLSLIPFTTGWMGENHFAKFPAAAYGAVLLMSGVAYLILQQRIIASQGEDSVLKKAVGSDWKGKLSPILYIVAILLAFVWSWLSVAIYAMVALMWIIPDRRIERILAGRE